MIMNSGANPHLKSWMLFVDGENVTIQGQKVLHASSVTLTSGQFWEKDVFLWRAVGSPDNSGRRAFFRTALEIQPDALRSYYYTSVTGSEETLESVSTTLWNIGFTPRVFKKAKKEQKSKGVDIALCTDMLSHAFAGHFDVAVLLAGDGDFQPLVDQVKRTGCIVVVGAFTEGLSPRLRLAADYFFELDHPFEQFWKQYQPTR
jgi:uncharacterized LabA/DUF88 family protein